MFLCVFSIVYIFFITIIFTNISNFLFLAHHFYNFFIFKYDLLYLSCTSFFLELGSNCFHICDQDICYAIFWIGWENLRKTTLTEKIISCSVLNQIEWKFHIFLEYYATKTTIISPTKVFPTKLAKCYLLSKNSRRKFHKMKIGYLTKIPFPFTFS